MRPVDFGADAIDLRRRRPFAFLDSCHAGRGGLTPTGIGGFAGALVESGASAVVASWWAHRGATGERFAELLWPMLLDGFPIGEAARRVRVILADERAEDPSRLAFQILAHPEATVDVSSTPLPRDRSLASPLRHDEPFLKIRRKEWSSSGSPGALLRADHEVVPFHLRNDELEDLEDWCLDQSTTVAVRLYTGPGGRGKTRLALELCRRFRQRGWRAGLVPRNELLQADRHALAKALASPPGALLAVVDYASSHSSTMNDRTGTVETLLSRLAERPSTEPVRIILLARSHDVWWRSLKRRLADRSSIPSRDLTWHTLGPLARAVTERVDSYHTARAAFRRALETTNGLDTEPDLSARHYEQVLLIHMKALAAVEGQLIAGEDGILDSMLEREEDFWCSRLERRRLDPSLLPGIKMAMALVTRLQGVSSQTRTVGLLAKLRIFADQPRATLMAVAQLLHEIYPGERWIMPLEPDLLGEHLDLDLDDEQADEVDDLIYGERSASPDSADSL